MTEGKYFPVLYDMDGFWQVKLNESSAITPSGDNTHSWGYHME
jgi:hypothetical protein